MMEPNGNDEDARAILERIDQNQAALIVLFEEKIDKLIDVIAGKNMVPLDVFKWLAVFLMVFTLLSHFPIEQLTLIIRELRALF